LGMLGIIHLFEAGTTEIVSARKKTGIEKNEISKLYASQDSNYALQTRRLTFQRDALRSAA
jgi:hypothetical protein